MQGGGKESYPGGSFRFSKLRAVCNSMGVGVMYRKTEKYNTSGLCNSIGQGIGQGILG
jgi:hypothetical protein